jgi:hypothetical protein
MCVKYKENFIAPLMDDCIWLFLIMHVFPLMKADNYVPDLSEKYGATVDYLNSIDYDI